MDLKLYQAPAIMEQLLNEVDEDWVFTEEALSKLDDLEIAIEDKAKGIGIILQRFEAFEDTISNEITRLQKLKKSYVSNNTRLKNYLSYNLKELNRDKIETDLFKFSFRKSTALDVLDEDIIPSKYFNKKVTNTLDKKRVIKDLKEWIKIHWVILQENKSLQIK